MRSLTWKISAAFVLTSLFGLALVAFFVGRYTISEFDRLKVDQQATAFIARITAYYEGHGSWDGLDAYLRLSPPTQSQNQPPQGAPPPNPQRQGPPPANPAPGLNPAPNVPPRFLVIDNGGTAVSSTAPYPAGTHISASVSARGVPIEIDGKQVGTIVDMGAAPELDPREQLYLLYTNRALLIATIGAATLAAVLGILLARRLTRPLRTLTQALHTFKTSNQAQPLPVKSNDEIGQLVSAFNQMSAELAHANQLRRQATADIAHELRSPLTVITGYLEALRDGALEPSSDRFEIIYGEALQLQGLVEDLRTLSLADAGELALELEEIRPAELLQDAAKSFSQLAESKQIKLSVDTTSRQLPPIRADRSRMMQVLRNVIGNALRYTPASGSIRLSANPAGEQVELIVSDTGAGIPQEKLPYIFDRLYRVDNSRYQPDGQTGLGLSIVKSLLALHGGTVSATSTPGQGTTITICLPAA